jgi:hypothetical protein
MTREKRTFSQQMISKRGEGDGGWMDESSRRVVAERRTARESGAGISSDSSSSFFFSGSGCNASAFLSNTLALSSGLFDDVPHARKSEED